MIHFALSQIILRLVQRAITSYDIISLHIVFFKNTNNINNNFTYRDYQKQLLNILQTYSQKFDHRQTLFLKNYQSKITNPASDLTKTFEIASKDYLDGTLIADGNKIKTLKELRHKTRFLNELLKLQGILVEQFRLDVLQLNVKMVREMEKCQLFFKNSSSF